MSILKQMKYITDLDGIKAINNSGLSETEKIFAKVEYLNNRLDSYPGDEKQKIQCFCVLDLGMDLGDNLNTITIGITQFGYATIKGDLGIIVWLLSKNVDVNSNVTPLQGATALHLAAGAGYSRSIEVSELLIQNHADVNQKTTLWFAESSIDKVEISSTPLSEAVRCGNVEIFKMLLATNKISEQSLIDAYILAKKIFNYIQENPAGLSIYLGSMNIIKQITEILQYFNSDLSGSSISAKKCLKERKIPEEVVDDIMAFTYSTYILAKLKSTESKIHEKFFFGLFFSPIQQKLNDSAVFDQHVATYGGNKSKAGALILR